MQQRKQSTRLRDNPQNGRKYLQMKQLTKNYLQNIQAALYQTTQSNMGRRPKRTFLQRRHIDGQQTLEKMLNITHYSGNAN